MTDTPGGSTHLHQPSQITLRIPVLPPISPSSPLSSLPPSPMSSPGSPLTPPPALTPPSPQASPSPPPAPAPALKIKLKAPQAEETASGPSAAGASSGAGSRRKRKSGLAEDTRRKRGKSDATDAVDAADAAIEDALDEPTPKRAAKAKPPPAKKARVRGKEGKTKDASTPVVGGESAKGEDVVMAEEAKDSLESISESRRPNRRRVVNSPPTEPEPSPARAPTPGEEKVEAPEDAEDKDKTPIKPEIKKKSLLERVQSRMTPKQPPSEDSKGSAMKETPKDPKRLPSIKKRPAGPPPSTTPARPVSLLASTLSKLSGKAGPTASGSAGEKKVDVIPERPRAGAWMDELVLTPEQEAQFAASVIQRNYAAAERAKAVHVALELQAARDAYRADHLGAEVRGRSIPVQGNSGLLTKNLPSAMIAAVIAGQARY